MSFLQISGLNIEPVYLIFISLTLLYVLFILCLAYGWVKLPEPEISNSGPIPFVSIIIAVRDEEEFLPLLIQSLEQQTFPPENFEVILVDDHSDKPLHNIPAVRGCTLLNFRVLTLSENEEGKKAALLKGASESKGEFLLFTDGDCRMSANWISLFSGYYRYSHPDMIIGLVDHAPSKSLLREALRLEFLSLVAAAAGSAQMNHPILCNGANIGIKRELYLSVSGKLNLQLRSGDDIFLLHAVKKLPECRIAVLKHREAIVYTQTPSSFYQFLHQRLRWSSKSTSYKDADTLLTAGLIFIFNFVILGGFVCSVLNILNWQIVLIMITGKILADAALLFPVLQFFGRRRIMFLFPVLQIVYPVYVSITAIISLIVPYRWKNRKANTGGN